LTTIKKNPERSHDAWCLHQTSLRKGNPVLNPPRQRRFYFAKLDEVRPYRTTDEIAIDLGLL